jgi:hypothetical protein
MVRGLKRVLLEEVARRATEEYYEAQRKAQGAGAHTSGDTGGADEEEVGKGKGRRGDKGTHEHTQQDRTESGLQGAAASGEGARSEREGSDAGQKRTRPRGGREHSDEGHSSEAEEGQSRRPHGRQQQGESSRKKQRQREHDEDEEGTRDAQAAGKRRARAQEGTGGEEEMEAAGSMRGRIGTHESKRRRVETEGREEWETGQGEPGGKRARSMEARGATTREHTARREDTAAQRDMRGLGTEDTNYQDSAAGRRESTQERARRETSDEEDDGVEHETTAAKPQREDEEEHEEATEALQAEGAADLVRCVSVNRPKRDNRGQPAYYPKKRKRTTQATGKKKSTAQKRQVDDGSGRGRVALENTIVVGRVYIQRMERKGRNRRDAGRPPQDPG